MDSFSFLLCLYAFAVIFIWLGVIQAKLNKISKRLQNNNQNEQQNEVQNIESDFIPQTFEPLHEPVQKAVQEPVQETTNEIIEEYLPKEEEKVQDVVVNEKPTKRAKSSFEEAFMGNIFNKIGAVAILIALCIFVKIISPFIIFTPEMKVATGLIAGVIMIYTSFKLRTKENMKVFSEVLMGTGFGAELITIYCGAGFLKVFSTPVALILAVITILSLYFIADKQKTVSAIVIGLIGGYLTPFFVNYHITMNFLFGYLIFLNALSLIFVYRNKKTNAINIINLIMTFLCISGFACVENDILTSQILSLWGLYVLYDIICITRANGKFPKSLSYINFAILTILSWIMYENNSLEIGIFMIIMAVIYLVLGLYVFDKTKEKENGYLYSCVLAVFIATFFLTVGESFLRIVFWSVEAAIFAAISFIFGMKKLFYISVGIFTSAICKLFVTNEIYRMNFEKIIINPRILYFLCPVISGCFMGFISKKYGKINRFEVFNFVSISLIYFYAILEINSIILDSGYYNRIFGFIIPIILFIYALNFNMLAKRAEKKTLYVISNRIAFWLGIVWLIFAEIIFDSTNWAILPLLNVRLASYTILGANIFYQLKNKETSGLKYLAIILGFLYVHFESVNTVCFLKGFEWIISVMWILYSGIISTIGICQNKKVLKTAGIWLSILTTVRLFLYDFANLEITYKLIAFIVLGTVLISVSYLYNKKSEK